MQIATSPTREKYPLSYKKIMKKTVSHSLVWVIIFSTIFVAFTFGFFSREGISGFYFIYVLIYLLLVGIVLVLNYLYQKWYFSVYFYDLTPDFIVIKKGPITPREITIPYERVQDVYVDQDLLDRMFGLFDVHLSSATVSSGMEAHIDGVEKTAADGLRQTLLTTVGEKIGRAKK